jgi:prophage maintenance system killer protein/predicted XRE-type DNA-binding protein
MTTTDNAIVLYQSPDGSTRLEVNLYEDTIWLAQSQLAELFDVNVPAVSKHVRNILESGELDALATVSKMERVQIEGERRVKRSQVLYNLDMIISIGYRVNSAKATSFRIWATQVLKDHIVKGYTVNEQRFREQAEKMTDMRRTVELLARTLANQELVSDTGKDVLRVIADYAYALTLLDRYDHGTLAIEGTTRTALHVIDYEEAIGIVATMKGENVHSTFGGLFGLEKDQGFKSALGAIYQTFGGEELYPSVEEKGANLLYFVVKNHAFSDGNKRIAAALFIYLLGVNGILYRSDGSKRLADNALVALTLLIAESRPDEKETIVKVIVNLINQNN